MTIAETVSATEAYRQRCEDRVSVFGADRRSVIVVADGAGGVGSGGIAAETVVREIECEYERIHSADEWSAKLKQIDCRIGAGESTAVVVDIRPYGIAGASVGDSRAWIISDGEITDLTKTQNRKPLLGSGSASPVPFMHPPLHGVLLMGTDGFFNYAKPDAIKVMVYQSDFYDIPRKCFEMVRLRSGDLWDDVGVVAVRMRPPHRSRGRICI